MPDFTIAEAPMIDPSPTSASSRITEFIPMIQLSPIFGPWTMAPCPIVTFFPIATDFPGSQ